MSNVSLSKAKQPSLARRIFAAREASVAIIVIVLCIVLAIATGGTFVSTNNIQATLMGLSADGIMAIGMTLVLITGGIDLSVGSVYGAAAMLCATAYQNWHINIWVAALIAFLFAVVLGVINGLFITKVKLTPFITTLGMMSVARGLSFVISKGSTIGLTGTDPAFTFLGGGIIGFIPMFTIIFIVLAIIFDILLRRSVPIRQVFYTGSNIEAARLSGIKTNKVLFLVYVVSAALCGLAAILYVSRFNTAAAANGEGTEMNCISACVIGGASLSGGQGTVLGAALGTILLNIVTNALVLLNISVYWQDFATGCILFLAVSIDSISQMRKNRK